MSEAPTPSVNSQVQPVPLKPSARALDLSKSILPSALCGLAGILMADHHAVVWVKAHAAEFMAALTAAWGFIERIQAAAPKILVEGQQLATAIAPIDPQASQELAAARAYAAGLEQRIQPLEQFARETAARLQATQGVTLTGVRIVPPPAAAQPPEPIPPLISSTNATDKPTA